MGPDLIIKLTFCDFIRWESYHDGGVKDSGGLASMDEVFVFDVSSVVKHHIETRVKEFVLKVLTQGLAVLFSVVKYSVCLDVRLLFLLFRVFFRRDK